ncbi:MAG: TIGR04190 family B12-binding domain/radical SAM domain protein [Candidatus Bathyarchaeota archaeon]|nr:TIGR04190 family B12-binding domain/radical SAM domain protein [Candidatus Bathyarchaeota archaeon]
MPGVDLVLLHAPSVYDFRKQPAMYGPISDVVPSTPVFEMYPLGFVSMVGYLEQNGYSARIVNLAVRMLKDPRFDVEKFLSKLEAQVYGFDLHWLAHAAGSLDLAEVVKEHHPDAPVLLGGLSSTYFHEEIIEHFPQVDYVLRGDTTEKPLLDLMNHVEAGREPEKVENLTWRSSDGRKRVNPLSFVPTEMDDMWIDYGEVMRMVLKHRDLDSTLPYESFMDYPFTAVLTCKGCAYNCITCGGSCYAFRNFFGRDGPAFKSPEKLVEEMRIISEYFKAPMFLIGDLRQGGRRWAEAVLDGIKESELDNTITYELFDMVPKDWMKKIAGSTDSWTLEISPESHDDSIRRIMGKPYTSETMEKTIRSALNHGAKKLDIYFMVGLSGQTSTSALESVEYARRLYEKMGDNEKIYCFTSPMAPFLDPGSKIYENPERYGFTKLYHTLREHKEALYQPSWKLYLSYNTQWMTRDEVAEATYEAMIRMNRLKVDMGVTDQGHGETVQAGLEMARDIMRKIDVIIATTSDPSQRQARYQELKAEIDDAKRSTGVAKRELRMPGLAGIRVKGALKFLLKYLRGS